MSTPSVAICTIALALLIAVPVSAGVFPQIRCESGKAKAAGKYLLCRQKAEAKYATSGDGAIRAAALQTCLDNYNLMWASLESKAVALGSTCRTVGDQSAIQGAIDALTTNVATALAGGALETDLATCVDGFSACSVDLATCQLWQPHFPATGQTTSCVGSGAVIPCAGTGQDGDTRAGLALSYTDNGDGTITDNTTGLMWEKLSFDGSIHDVSNGYTFDEARTPKVAEKLATLNSQSFAGYTDWRVPNVKELFSLVNYGVSSDQIALSPEFDTNCSSGCTVLTCSCATTETWTSNGWLVSFSARITVGPSTTFYPVRAVRGGS